MGIEINAPAIRKIDVKLVGKDYKVTAPKTAIAIELATRLDTQTDGKEMASLVDEFIGLIFNKSDAEVVKKRMLNPKDRLDLEQILDLLEKLIESIDNPTT